MALNACMSPTFYAPPGTTAATEHTVPTSSIVPLVQNIVATCNLCCTLDLTEIARQVPNAEYDPRRLHAIVVRRRTPKATAFIFASGKLRINGAASEADARLAALKNARIIQKLGYRVRFREFEIRNILGSAAIGAETEGIHLRSLARDYREFISYEPEQFPGLQYQMANPKVSLIIFHNGKIVINGAKTLRDFYSAFDKILPIVRQYPLRMVATSEMVNSKETQKLNKRRRY